MNQKKSILILTGTILLSFLMHFHVFKKDLVGYHVWRQTQTQINIENFYKVDFNILNPRLNDRGDGNGIVRLEFPIMQWLFACFYKIFGNYIIISRILSFIVGIFSVMGIFFLLKNVFRNNTIGLIGAWTFSFSPLFYYYTVNPMPDNFALCCSIWGMTFFIRWISDKSLVKIILTGFFLSLGALAKLPFILCLVVPLVYFFIKKNVLQKNILFLILLLCFMSPVFLWYMNVVTSEWTTLTHSILGREQESTYSILDILQFNLISTLPELLVNYGSMLFFLSGFYFIYKNKAYKNPFFSMFFALSISVLLYFFFEMNLIAKVHDYYLFPFLPLIFIIVSYGCFHLLNSQKKYLVRFCLFLLLILPVTAYLRANTRWNIQNPGFNPDLLIFKNELRTAVPDSVLCIAGNDESKNIFFYYINKKGWAFDNNNLSAERIKTMINKGAQYLYSDSRVVDDNSEISFYLDSLLTQYGSIRVYRLKKTML